MTRLLVTLVVVLGAGIVAVPHDAWSRPRNARSERARRREAQRRRFRALVRKAYEDKVARAQRLRSAGKLGSCPAEMVQVLDYCIDRHEVRLVDGTTGTPLSPHYSPRFPTLKRVFSVWQFERKAMGPGWLRDLPLPPLPPVQKTGQYVATAASRDGVVPSGYLDRYSARRVCRAAGKRLCQDFEWLIACQGERQTPYPYGPRYVAGRCNVHRDAHPAQILHGHPSVGHTDPRLNLVIEAGVGPLLHRTGATPGCVSRWGNDGVHDMVGNLDEWTATPGGVFRGGFYSRSTTKGCWAVVSAHAPSYYDYSLGTRCCRAPDPPAPAPSSAAPPRRPLDGDSSAPASDGSR